MKACHKSIEDIPLFHVTDKRNLASIAQNGLQPDISDLTVEAYFNNQWEQKGLDEDNPDDVDSFTVEHAEEELNEQYPDGLVFAAEFENLAPVISMMANNPINPIGMKHIAVLGIKDRCAGQFQKTEIGSDADMISPQPIPADCLCFIDTKTWKNKLGQNINRFRSMY
jgi:hypothetical protein